MHIKLCTFRIFLHIRLCNQKKHIIFAVGFPKEKTMKTLFFSSERMLSQVDTTFVRYLHDKIDWSARLTAILGARGVGKTTLILQHILLAGQRQEALYVTADDFYFQQHRLFDLALQFYQQGGKYLYIDEVHKYKGWSTELKNIYDQIPQLNVVYTGSSILDLERGGADLSRRRLSYTLHGLSFREYLNLSQRLSLPAYSLQDILDGKVVFPMKDLRPLQLFRRYMQSGYYPFFREKAYHERLNSVLKQVVEVDIPAFADMNIASSQKLKKLLYVLAQSVPFKPNYQKLERDMGISRNTLPQYMLYLEKAGLINVLREKATGLKMLEKVEKVYLNNPNMAEALSDAEPDIGYMRETVFFAWLRVAHNLKASPVSDFETDGITFEVGGKNKGKKQIEGLKDAYIVKDDTEYKYMNEIPLWHFGFIY